MVTGQAMAEFDQLLPTLLELGLSNPIALQEVQARQVIYGGDLQLNLLELGSKDGYSGQSLQLGMPNSGLLGLKLF